MFKYGIVSDTYLLSPGANGRKVVPPIDAIMKFVN
jgi:hypothetical protein